jgi:hypothetical protein
MFLDSKNVCRPMARFESNVFDMRTWPEVRLAQK